jgi:hypothetical protein
MVEETTRKREYAMSDSSEMTVNSKIVVPRSRKQSFKALMHVSINRHGASDLGRTMLWARQQGHESR